MTDEPIITYKPSYHINRLAWNCQPKEFYDLTGEVCEVDIAIEEATRSTRQ